MTSLVRDPNFWRRFSAAVHLDDAAKEELKERPNLQHSYVLPPLVLACTPEAHESVLSSSPTSQHSLLSPMEISFQSPAPALLATKTPRSETWDQQQQQGKEKEKEAPAPAQKPKSYSSKLRKNPSTRSTAPLLPSKEPPASAFTLSRKQRTIHISTCSITIPSPSHHARKYSLRSPSSLSLSGLPRTHFKTWTTITAGPDAFHEQHRAMDSDEKQRVNYETNPLNRPSWLEAQKKKSRQRTWMCWAFWLGIMLLVAGVVVAVVVLRAHRII